MTFGRSIVINLFFNKKPLGVVNSYRCLGFLVNPISIITGSVLKDHPDYLCNHARNAVFSILSKTRQVGDIPPQCMMHLYQSMVQPILLYGSDIWGHHKASCKTVDTLILWFARAECGGLPPSVHFHIDVLLYAICLNNITHEDPLKSVFEHNVYLHELGFNTWYTKVLKLANI